MSLLASSGPILRDLSLTQSSLTKDVRALSSGLRVSSSVDDPSGLAIAGSLQAQANGLQQSVTNVQAANNLLNVADGALNAVTDILQRINSLIVEAKSDLNSVNDTQNLQAEIGQLLQEINKIGSSTTFNGLNLFNGQFDTSTGTTQGTFQQITPPIGPVPDATNTGPNVTNADGLGDPGPLISNPGAAAGAFIPSIIVFQVTGFSNNAIDPDSGINQGPGVFIQETAFSNDPSFGAAPELIDISAVPINAGQIGPTQFIAPSGTSVLLQNVNVANLTQADVGTTIAFETSAATPAGHGSALTVNDGGQEGSIVNISLPTISTNQLNLSNITVIAPNVVNFLNQVQGQSSSNEFVAGDAELRVQAAIQTITSTRALIGAQSVALQENVNNDSTAILGLTSSQSGILDLNVGTATTKFTQDQILLKLGQSVLAQSQTDAQTLSNLLFTASKIQ